MKLPFKLPAFVTNIHMTRPEWTAVIAMLFFVALPVPVPLPVADIIASMPGVAIVFAINVALLLYTSPYIGVVAILAATELVRRSYHTVGLHPKYIPAASKPNAANASNTPSFANNSNASLFTREQTLEESMVDQMAPVGQAPASSYVETVFKPVYSDAHNALPM